MGYIFKKKKILPFTNSCLWAGYQVVKAQADIQKQRWSPLIESDRFVSLVWFSV